MKMEDMAILAYLLLGVLNIAVWVALAYGAYWLFGQVGQLI